MTSVFDEPRKTSPDRLRWFVGVPVGTNPLILLDVGIMIAIAWMVSFVVLFGLQRAFGGSVGWPQIRDILTVSSYLSLVFLTIFLVGSFALLRNRYGALYVMDREETFCQNMQGSLRALDGLSIHWRGFPIEPMSDPTRSVERRCPWKDVRSVQCLDGPLAILLRGKRGVLMRVYCPDRGTYEDARKFALKQAAEYEKL